MPGRDIANAASPGKRWNPWPLKTWIVLLSLSVPILLLGAWMAIAADRETKADAATESLARQLAGGPVQVFTGSKHTVYQAAAPLPTEAAPRADGKPTLVWFSTAACSDCAKMEKYAFKTGQQYAGRFVFVEKAADRDSSAARYNVTETPTFVLIDARGVEVARFGYEPDVQAFAGAIEAALTRLPG